MHTCTLEKPKYVQTNLATSGRDTPWRSEIGHQGALGWAIRLLQGRVEGRGGSHGGEGT